MSTCHPVPFKVFGLQRSGTNLMVALMERNFHTHSLEIGAEWKHGVVEQPDRTWNGAAARFVLCVKNPYAWLVSCYRYFQAAHGADGTVAPQFRADPSMSFEEFVLGPSYEFETPVHRWNAMHRHWLGRLPPDRTAVVRHEDEVADPVAVLEAVRRKLGLRPSCPRLEGIQARVDVRATLGARFDVTYYRERAYLREFTPALAARADGLLEPEVLGFFGYVRQPGGIFLDM